jgi:hypothetical protein
MCVLDVHSVPQDAEPYGPYEAVLLDDAAAPRAYMRALHAHLVREADARATVMRGANNDIQDEMRALGVPCVLLEVHEALPPERRDALADATARWLIAHIDRAAPVLRAPVRLAAGPPPDASGAVGAALFVLGESIIAAAATVWCLRAAPEREGCVRLCAGATPVCEHVVPLEVAREWLTRGRTEGVATPQPLCVACVAQNAGSTLQAPDDGVACRVELEWEDH